MEQNIVQLHNVNPEEFKNEILSGVQNKLDALQESINSHKQSTYLTRKDVSALLGVSLVTIHDWCKKDILKPMRIGNRVRFIRKDIEDYLEASRKSK